jgi:hypothetical protein
MTLAVLFRCRAFLEAAAEASFDLSLPAGLNDFALPLPIVREKAAM